jgi:hypothetical protein
MPERERSVGRVEPWECLRNGTRRKQRVIVGQPGRKLQNSNIKLQRLSWNLNFLSLSTDLKELLFTDDLHT